VAHLKLAAPLRRQLFDAQQAFRAGIEMTDVPKPGRDFRARVGKERYASLKWLTLIWRSLLLGKSCAATVRRHDG